MFIFDVRDLLHPKTATSFIDIDGFMHPHYYLRLPNMRTLARRVRKLLRLLIFSSCPAALESSAGPQPRF